MAAGIQVFNADGSLQFDMSGRIFRMIGRTETAPVDGWVNMPGAATGTLVVMKTPIQNSKVQTSITITQNGTIISWAYDPIWAVDQRQTYILTFMVY